MVHLLTTTRRKLFTLSMLLAMLVGGVVHANAETITEDFESVSLTDANGNNLANTWSYGYGLSNGWKVIGGTIYASAGNTNYGLWTTAHSGSKSLEASYSSSNSAHVVITKKLSGTFTFWARKTSSSSSTKGKITLYEATESDGTFTVSSTQLYPTNESLTTTWTQYEVDLGDEGKYVAINLVRAAIDDIEGTIFEETGSIAKPTAFAATSTTYNSATLSWTAGGEETAWQLVYDTNADFDKDAATPIDVTENPYTLSGLTPETTYYAYLRAKSGEDVSSWTSKISFTTPEQYAKPTAFALTGYTATTASFSWIAGSTETIWELAYSTDENFDPATSGTKVNVTTNPYTLEGLTAETTYYAYIRANYGSGYSGWSEKVSFTPSNVMNATVNDGTGSNSYVPIYGSYTDTEGTASQFIIPSSSLTDIANRQITKMTFYSTSSNINWGAKFKVYLKETTDTEFADATFNWTGMDEVAEATVSLSNGQMVIEFDSPFDYSNGNLMVGLNLAETGDYQSCSWVGVTTSNYSSIYSYKGWSGLTTSRVQFLPKVTFSTVPQSDTPKAKMVVASDPIEFGKVTPETEAADKQKTFTIGNTGKADLTNISIVSSEPVFKVGEYATSIAQGAEAITVTVTMDAETAGDYEGTITVTADDQTAATINVTGTYANAPATMTITPSVEETIAFGVVNKETKKTFTISNTGDVKLNVTSIESSNTTDFTVSPSTLEVAAGETGEFTVTFVYDDKAIDEEKTANITLKATGLDDKTFSVTGTRSDVWSEDFEEGKIPEGWDNNGFVVKMESVGSYPTYELPTYFAVGNGGSGEKTLVTPLLKATAGDKLTFDGFFYYGDEVMKVDYSTDRNEWNNLYEYDKTSYSSGETHNIEISAPITGEFYLRFTVNYFNGIDNIVGFKLATKKEHDAIITAQSIPATGTQYVEYTATVTVKELAGKEDEVVMAELWIGTEKVAEVAEVNLTANDEKVIELIFTPDKAISGDAYIKVYNDDIELTSEKMAVEINAALVLDETVGLGSCETGKQPVVVKYTAKSGWNTICVPFVLTSDILNQIFGEGWKAYEFKAYSNNELTFNNTTTFYAGFPYIVYVAEAATHENGLILHDVNISATSANYDSYGSATFQGTYAPMAAGEMEGKWGITTDGHIAKGGAKATLKGFRAYFELPEGATAPVLSLEDGPATSISLTPASAQAEEVYYDLNGRRVEKPTKGLYIINGKKVMVK